MLQHPSRSGRRADAWSTRRATPVSAHWLPPTTTYSTTFDVRPHHRRGTPRRSRPARTRDRKQIPGEVPVVSQRSLRRLRNRQGSYCSNSEENVDYASVPGWSGDPEDKELGARPIRRCRQLTSVARPSCRQSARASEVRDTPSFYPRRIPGVVAPQQTASASSH